MKKTGKRWNFNVCKLFAHLGGIDICQFRCLQALKLKRFALTGRNVRPPSPSSYSHLPIPQIASHLPISITPSHSIQYYIHHLHTHQKHKKIGLLPLFGRNPFSVNCKNFSFYFYAVHRYAVTIPNNVIV